MYTSRQTKFILIQKLKILSEKVLVDSVRREGYMLRSCGGVVGGGGIIGLALYFKKMSRALKLSSASNMAASWRSASSAADSSSLYSQFCRRKLISVDFVIIIIQGDSNLTWDLIEHAERSMEVIYRINWGLVLKKAS